MNFPPDYFSSIQIPPWSKLSHSERKYIWRFKGGKDAYEKRRQEWLTEFKKNRK